MDRPFVQPLTPTDPVCRAEPKARLNLHAAKPVDARWSGGARFLGCDFVINGGQKVPDPSAPSVALREGQDADGPPILSGEFNGDGLADLVIGMPGCDAALQSSSGISEIEDSGAIVVCWGLPPAAEGCAVPDPFACEVMLDPQGAEPGAHFGASLAAWDWVIPPALEANPSGWTRSAPPKHALWVGAPGASAAGLPPCLGSPPRAGVVRGLVFDRGVPDRISADWTVEPRFDYAGAPEDPCLPEGMGFGHSLATGRFDGGGLWPSYADPWWKTPQLLAIGAPHLAFVAPGGGLVDDLGAVQVVQPDPSGIVRAGWLNTQLQRAPSSVEPGFTGAVFRHLLPAPVCAEQPLAGGELAWSQALGPAACPEPPPGRHPGSCGAALFGWSLAAGRFLEGDERALGEGLPEGPHGGPHEDLAIGAPGSRGTSGLPGSGAVDVLAGESITRGNAAEVVRTAKDGCPDLHIESWRWPGDDLGASTERKLDAAPEEADGYGYALAAAELLRTQRSNDEGHLRHELIVGVPFEDLSVWDGVARVWDANAIADAGLVCVTAFSDSDLDGIYAQEEQPKYGVWTGDPQPHQQHCLATGATVGSTAFGDGPVEGARLGTSVIGGRLSAWDDDVQIAAGAPGMPPVNSEGVLEVGAERGPGAVFVFYLRSVFDGVLALAWSEALEMQEQAPRYRAVPGAEPGTQPMWATQQIGGSPANRVPAGFGASLGWSDLNCSGHGELIVSAPRLNEALDPAQRGLGDVYAAPWKVDASAVDADWSGVYGWTPPGNHPDDYPDALWPDGGALRAAVFALEGAGQGPASAIWSWSLPNTSFVSTAGVEASCSIPDACADGVARHFCIEIPANLFNVPTRHPALQSSGMPVQRGPPGGADELRCAADPATADSPQPDKDRPHPQGISWTRADAGDWTGWRWPQSSPFGAIESARAVGGASITPPNSPVTTVSMSSVLGDGVWQGVQDDLAAELVGIAEAFLNGEVPVPAGCASLPDPESFSLDDLSFALHLLKPNYPAAGADPLGWCLDVDLTVAADSLEDPCYLDLIKWINWERAPVLCADEPFPSTEDLALPRLQRLGDFDCERPWHRYP